MEETFFGGALGIFGHGNVAGIGQALLQYRKDFRLYQGRNEQGMVHIATGYAKMKNRLGAMAVTTSIGPGATNMITGAATATVNRLPVLCLPSDIFASRRTGPVLQQLESNFSWDYSASDAFKAVSKYWDRINRPDQLPQALLEAMRTLTSPADTGAVTISLPQDVQAEAWDFPELLFRPRTWHVPRARADRGALRRAARLIAGAKRPVIIAGGGVIYSAATAELAEFVSRTGIPVGVTQAGKASLRFDHPQMVNALGASGSVFANKLANEADVIIGIGTRYTDFTTASNTLFRNPDVQFINLNVTELDAYKESALGLVGDARESISELDDLLPATPSAPSIAPRSSRPRQAGGPRSTGSSRSRTARPCPRPRRSASSTPRPATTTSWSTRPARCRATCTDCGGPATRRPTTWSTATPAWATRSAARSARRWPTRAGTCSASSATAPSCCPARRS